MLSDSPGLSGALPVGSAVVGTDARGWRGQSRCHRVRARKGRLVQTHEVGRRSTSHFCANPHLLAPHRPERGGWHKHTRLAVRIPLPPIPRVPERGGCHKHTRLAVRNHRGRRPCIHATPPSERTHQPEPPLGPCSRCVIPRSEQRLHRSSGSAPRLSTTCCRAGTA